MSLRHLEQKLSSHKYTAKTSKAYTSWIRQLRDYTGKEDLTKIPPSTITSFLERQNRRGLKSESVRQAIAALKFYYRHVTQRPDIISSLPAIKRTRPKTHIPDQSEIVEIIDRVKGEEIKLLFYLIYGAGLELGEAIALPAKAVNPNKLTLGFKTQRSKIRETPLPKAIAQELVALAATRSATSPLFQHKGARISANTAQRAWAKARQDAHANPRIDIRSLRHAYISHLTRSGFLIQEVLEHLQLSSSVALEYYSQYVDIRKITTTPLDQSIDKIPTQSTIYPYVSHERLGSLLKIQSSHFDLSRVNAMLHEMNESARAGNLHSVALLLRALIDHTAPVFGARTFKEFISSTSLPRSLKKNFELLDTTLRNIADLFLHDHISRRVLLPTELQVDFRQAFDQYLGHLIGQLKKGST
jgi:site-specific recombinase XerC